MIEPKLASFRESHPLNCESLHVAPSSASDVFSDLHTVEELREDDLFVDPLLDKWSQKAFLQRAPRLPIPGADFRFVRTAVISQKLCSIFESLSSFPPSTTSALSDTK